MKRTILLLLVIGECVLLSCSPKYSKYVASYASETKLPKPDYSKLYYWAAHPYKHDPSDSVPAPLVKTMTRDSTIDVFFLHPSTLTLIADTAWNADINDPVINAKTDYRAILYQASAFNEFRVFAPRYRQAHYRSYFATDTVLKAGVFDLAYQDVKDSFQYYLDHYNNGRPIIIASHSQGSTHAQRLLKEFFEKSNLKNRLVVAYIIGMYIPANSFSNLKMCQDSLETGCLVGWRTYKKGFEPSYVTRENKSGLVTNPLTWTTTGEYAPFKLNKGGVISNFTQIRPAISDAQIHDGVLWISRPNIPGSFLMKTKDFHVGDINLFYMNIRQNARQRVNAFWKR